MAVLGEDEAEEEAPAAVAVPNAFVYVIYMYSLTIMAWQEDHGKRGRITSTGSR